MSAWLDHVRRWAAENGETFNCALSNPKCKAAYNPPAKTSKSKTEKAPAKPKAPKAPRAPKKPTAKNPVVAVAKKLYKRQDNAREQMYQFKKMKDQRFVANAEPLFGMSPQRLVANSAPPAPLSDTSFGMSPSRAMGVF